MLEADGGSRGNPGPAGYGAVLKDADTGEVVAEVAAGIGRATNNVAEYRGLIAGLQAAAELSPVSVEVRMDSKLVIEQMAGRWQVKHPDMRELRRTAAEAVQRLTDVRFRHIPRAQNAHADRLANEAMDAAARGQVWQASAPRVSVTPAEATDPAELADPDEPADPAESAGPMAPGAARSVAIAQLGWSAPSSAPCSMLLLRHGQTALSVQKRFSGTGDPPLTDVGRAQAWAAAARLASYPDVAAVLSSPRTRARDTATLVASALSLEVQVDDDLRETDFGAWEGHTFAEVSERWPAELAAWLADPEVAPPGGESFAATASRIRRARDRMLTAQPGRTVVVVAHVTPIKSLVRLALQAPPSALYRLHLDPASLSRVDWYADGPAVVRLLNDTSHIGQHSSG